MNRRELIERSRDAGNYRNLIVLLVLGLLAFYFTEYVIMTALVVATAAIAVAVNQFELRITGIELATFTTVLAGMAYGPKTGAVAGFFLVLLQMVFGGQVGLYSAWVLPGYAIAGALAGIVTGYPVNVLGIALTVALHAVFSVFTLAFTPGGLGKYAPYAIGNIILNALLFTYLAPVVLGVL